MERSGCVVSTGVGGRVALVAFCVVAMDRHGNVAFSFNTSGMYRGYLQQGGKSVVRIYRD